MNRRERWGLLSKIVTNATNRTCQHPPSWIFQMLRCILWSEMSLLLTTHIFSTTFFFLMAPNFLALATTLENLGARWLLAKKVNFVPCLPMDTNAYEENIAQILSGSPNLNYFGDFSRHIVRTAKIWPNFFKFQSMSILTYPGCQRLFMRGFRFRSSLKKWLALRSCLRPFGRRRVGLRPTKRSSPSHARKNPWYPG